MAPEPERHDSGNTRCELIDPFYGAVTTSANDLLDAYQEISFLRFDLLVVSQGL